MGTADQEPTARHSQAGGRGQHTASTFRRYIPQYSTLPGLLTSHVRQHAEEQGSSGLSARHKIVVGWLVSVGRDRLHDTWILHTRSTIRHTRHIGSGSTLKPSPWLAWARLSLHNNPKVSRTGLDRAWAWWEWEWARARGHWTWRLLPPFLSLDRRHCSRSQDGKDGLLHRSWPAQQ